jgi:hypothetical protein
MILSTSHISEKDIYRSAQALLNQYDGNTNELEIYLRKQLFSYNKENNVYMLDITLRIVKAIQDITSPEISDQLIN